MSRNELRAHRRGQHSPMRQRANRCSFSGCMRYGFVLIPLFLVVLVPLVARADVQSIGNVIPARNPFDPNTFPGLPTIGNFIDPTPGPGSDADDQTTFEGIVTFTGNPPQIANPQVDVIVGETSYGAVLISSNTALRDQDLIIGDMGQINGQDRFGTGVFRISGIGALYNNDPTILPFGLDYATFGSKRDETIGFDLYVGRFGNGTLDINAGGRAEIQDAVIVGDQAGSVGTLIVDGIDSYLGSGGFNAGGGGEVHTMIIGRRGIGYMTVSNGATVVSEAPPTSGGGTAAPIGAVIGSDPYTSGMPDPGGNGTVTVSGPASDWNVGGSLQVGGYHDSGDIITGADIEGDEVDYPSEVGRGTLHVQNGALVNIRAAIGSDPQTDELLLAIGRFGRVEMDGGTITIGATQTDDPRSDRIQVINDGTILGSGRINTGVFRNRYLGEVRVEAGDKLIIDSSSEFAVGGTDAIPMINYGLIQVFGTVDNRAELEFIRDPDLPGTPAVESQPFINRMVFTPGSPGSSTKFSGGIISAQHATLRSGSGFQNEGVLSFTAGINNIRGQVTQMVGPALPAFVPRIVIGPETTVVAEDDFTVAPGILTLVGPASRLIVNDPGTFTSSSQINLHLSIANPSTITAVGDIAIGGFLNLSLANDVLADLQAFGPGAAYEVISFGGGAFQPIEDSNGFWGADYSSPIPDCGSVAICTVPGLGVVTPDLGVLLGPAFADVIPIAQRIGQSIVVKFFDLAAFTAEAPDFNNDGVIDNLDLAIWEANAGIEMGASILQGDADGDGDVDGDDLLFWARNVGQPPPWAGAGAGNGLSASVPEPTALALLLSGGLLALACRRSRRSSG